MGREMYDLALGIHELSHGLARRHQPFEQPHRLDSSAWVSARLAELLPLPLALKQELLEADAPARLERLGEILKRAA